MEKNNIFEALKFTWDKYSTLANIFITFSSGTALLIINSAIGKTLTESSKYFTIVALVFSIFSLLSSVLWVFVIHFFSVVELLGKKENVDKYYKDAGIIKVKITNNYEKVFIPKYRILYRFFYFACPILTLVFLSVSWLMFLNAIIKMQP